MSSTTDTIYLDHAATTAVEPSVLQQMLPYFSDEFGNPSSIYELGQTGHHALDHARTIAARILNVRPSEIIFTSGATESNNLALSGSAWAARLANPEGPAPHIITSAIEHSAVLESARWLERIGFAVTYLPVDNQGFISPADISAAIRPETCLVSVMYANNEVGSIQDLLAIAEVCRQHQIPLHTDAVQAAGSCLLDVQALGVNMLALSAHKFGGPKGVGLLAVRAGTPLEWQQRGGGQESGRRGGTENVPLIVGLAAALEIADQRRTDYVGHCAPLRDALFQGLRRVFPDLALNGPADFSRRLANNLNVSFPGIQGETLLLAMDMEGIAASAGSACTVGKVEPSHVLLAMGAGEEIYRSSVRFTLGWDNTPDQIDEAIDIMTGILDRMKTFA